MVHPLKNKKYYDFQKDIETVFQILYFYVNNPLYLTGIDKTIPVFIDFGLFALKLYPSLKNKKTTTKQILDSS